MLDIKLIRKDPELVRKNLERRKDPEKIKLLEDLLREDEKWREELAKLNDLRRKRNLITQEITELKKQGKDVSKKLKEAKEIPDKIKSLEGKTKENERKVKNILIRIPNLLHESVPFGKDEKDNIEIRKWGKAPKLDFKPKNHLEVGSNLGLIDFESAVKASGHGFPCLKEGLVLLDLAIQKFAVDFLTKKGYKLIEPPFMVNEKTYEAMIGDPTDFAEASYKVEGEKLYLIPTAEYPLGGIFLDKVFNKKQLPLKLVGISPCFRKEVGTHGKYARGLFRMHQFNKVEQFVLCLPKQSWKLFEEIQKDCEELYQKLGLHHRVVNVCTGEIGVKAAKKYDTEVWMADGKFRESGSNSNCTDYQARRLNIRFREKEGQSPIGFVHTLNNTALATSRTMLAILEQFQQKDGSVIIPKVLRPWMNGIEKLEKK
jgi:seryl-tRNA synthetase